MQSFGAQPSFPHEVIEPAYQLYLPDGIQSIDTLLDHILPGNERGHECYMEQMINQWSIRGPCSPQIFYNNVITPQPVLYPQHFYPKAFRAHQRHHILNITSHYVRPIQNTWSLHNLPTHFDGQYIISEVIGRTHWIKIEPPQRVGNFGSLTGPYMRKHIFREIQQRRHIFRDRIGGGGRVLREKLIIDHVFE